MAELDSSSTDSSAATLGAPAAVAPQPVPEITEMVNGAAEPAAAAPLDPAVVALCTPIAEDDPCGPDLDLEGDGAYLNFFAQAEGVLPVSFFDPLTGAPFDRSQVDIAAQLAAINDPLRRSRDVRLLVMRARLQILDRDFAGFAISLAAAAYWLDAYWDQVHPRPEGDDLTARITAISALDTPTVTLPVQYAPLFDARRLGAMSYRRLMIANDEVKPRPGEDKLASGAIMEALGEADTDKLAAIRGRVVMLKAALERIRNAFAMHGASAGLDSLPALIAKIHGFIDPIAAAETAPQAAEAEAEQPDTATAGKTASPGPKSLAEASEALAAIADYYGRLEPSSPTLPLVRQAHQLIGKSFIEIMNILVPGQVEKAAFQIGGDQVFDLPVGRLSNLSATEAVVAPAPGSGGDGVNGAVGYSVKSRAQAIALLEQVQRFFRTSEPSSPIPMLCERARALAERDFMGVLRDVLPKAALRNPAAER